MSKNFFKDNADLLFHFSRLSLDDVIRLRENGFANPAPGTPYDIPSALNIYRARLEQVGELSAENIAPRAAQADLEGAVCVNNVVSLPEPTQRNLRELRKAGLMGVTLPRKYGGLNFPTTIYSMMTEIVSRADASLQNLFGLQSIAETIRMFGSDEQKNTLLPPFASGEMDGAMALTEPDAGSDLQSTKVTATLDDNGVWRLNGIKHFITNGSARILLVLARSEEGTRDGRGLSMFIAHPCPELVVNRIEDKMGIHASPTCELQFNNAPAELVGRRRFGLTRYVMSLMNGARLAIGAQAVGLMEATRQAAWNYCNERTQFGRKLAELIPVREMLTRIDALTVASRSLLYETCKWVDLRDAWNTYAEEHPDDADARAAAKNATRLADVLTPITKAFATESANSCAYDCIQCHGGKGYMRERPVERFYRDARIMNIYEGTTQMQVIAATAGILKHSLEIVLDKVTDFRCPPEAQDMLRYVNDARKAMDAAMAAYTDTPEVHDLLSRRLVRGYSIVLAAYLLLRELTPDRLAVTARFIWEFIPEALMHAKVMAETAEKPISI